MDILQISTNKKLFVAYPWDMYIKNMYHDIFKEIFDEWDIRHGSDVTLKDTDLSEVEKFLNRNKHLYDIFVSSISKSDFFIADVTGTNPNVMLELGVAIQLNKNILIVTSDDLGKLPFDIRGFRVSKYKDKTELIDIIKNELKTFNKIKSQHFSKYINGFYFSYPADGELRDGQMLSLPIPKNIKNLRFRCQYKFQNTSNSHDWFGVHLRAQLAGIVKSELVYVRMNQKLESVSFPGQRPVCVGKTQKETSLEKEDGYKILEIIIDENELKAITPDSYLEDNKVKMENLGGIGLQVFAHNPSTREDLIVSYRKIEIVSLDTTTPI